MDHTEKLLGRYKPLDRIEDGTTGEVHLCWDEKIHRKVAVKCIRPKDLGDPEDVQKRFRKEVQALGKCRHPNIVTIYNVGEDSAAGTLYIEMEYVEGGSLSHLLKTGTTLTLDQIIQIGVDICNALHYAHSKGVTHRDIKPANILLTSDQKTAKVTDFGIAQLDEGGDTKTSHFLGTPAYMSPEQYQGKKVDGRSDLFSVGVLLYELCTRRKPFSGDNLATLMNQVLTQVPVPPATLSPNIPKPLSDIVMKAMKKDPHQRFATGAEMAEALASLTGDKGADPHPTIRLAKSVPRFSLLSVGRRWIWVGGVAIAVGIVAVSSGFIFMSRQEPSTGTSVPSLVGIVDFTSMPIAANVRINGEMKGVTPFVLKLPAGSYELVLNKEGYYPLEATITVTAGERIPVALKLTEKEAIP